MRLLLALASVLALAALAPSATAAQCPPVCVYVDVDHTRPSSSCPDCVGVTVGAGTLDPVGCHDCGGVGVEAGVNHANGETTVHVLACRGGFIHICFVDERVTV
jgi:hypothetical protein